MAQEVGVGRAAGGTASHFLGALASALVKTAEYRNPRPHPVLEFLFYTHPSVERRVRTAMEWKAADK